MVIAKLKGDFTDCAVYIIRIQFPDSVIRDNTDCCCSEEKLISGVGIHIKLLEGLNNIMFADGPVYFI